MAQQTKISNQKPKLLLTQNLLNFLQHQLRFFHRLVRKPNHPQTQVLQNPVPILIIRLPIVVNAAIQFHHQLFLVTIKVSNKKLQIAEMVVAINDRVLPQKFVTIEFPIPHQLPQRILFRRLIAAQLPGELGDLFSGDAGQGSWFNIKALK